MSKSITELLQSIALNTDNVKRKDNEIYNSEGLHNEQVMEIDESIEISDQYNNVMKIEGIYNGAYLPLKENGLHKLMGQRKFDFTLTSAIDPNFKRSKIDPDSALPSYNKYSKFSLMPESVEPPHNQISLVKESKASYLNYRNRLNPEQQQQQTAPQLAPRDSLAEEGYKNYADDYEYEDSPPAYEFDDDGMTKKDTTIHKDDQGEVVHTTDHIDETHDPVEEEEEDPLPDAPGGPQKEIPVFSEDVPPTAKYRHKEIPVFNEDVPPTHKVHHPKTESYLDSRRKPPSTPLPTAKYRRKTQPPLIANRSSNLLFTRPTTFNRTTR